MWAQSYGSEWKVADIYRDASKIAIAYVEGVAVKDRKITIVGTPSIVQVMTRKYE